MIGNGEVLRRAQEPRRILAVTENRKKELSRDCLKKGVIDGCTGGFGEW